MIEIIRIILKMFFKVFYRVEIKNLDKVPEKGGALLCSNHQGEMDMFFIGYKMKRLIHFMAKEELFKIPVISPIIKFLGAFPIKRGKGDVGAIKTTLKILQEGKIVGIFPEGTRTRGKLAEDIKVKPGVAMIAIKAGVPILPVAIEGSYKPFSRIRVVFGEPFNLNIDKDMKYSNEQLTEMSCNIMKRVYGLLEGK